MVQLVRVPHAPCPLPPGGGGWARGKRPTPARRAHALSIQITLFLATMSKRIDKFIIEKIIDTAKIEEVVGDFIDLKKKGVRYLGLCPFHDDRHIGSFVVYPKGNCYKCFVCGASGDSVKFLMENQKMTFPDVIRWLGKKYSIEVDDVPFDYTPRPPRPAPPPLKMLVLPKYLMARTLTDAELERDNLIRWIKTGIKWDTVQRSRIKKVLSEYCVGHGKNGHTIFWQMDTEGNLRTGKMMKYYPEGHPKFGKRDREASWNFDFIHATLSRHWDEKKHEMTDEPPYPFPDLYDPDKQEPSLTFFGMHLLKHYPRATVHIVESEKTAMLMAIAYGNHATQVWIACGGLEMLSRERLAPIINQGRKVILYPDRDGIAKWKAKAKQIGYDRIQVDTDPVLKWWREGDGEKADIADVVIRMINNSKPLTTIQDVAKEMTAAKPLIDKLNLTIDNDG